jgi:transcriptional regulator with XRE-family HTH domain
MGREYYLGSKNSNYQCGLSEYYARSTVRLMLKDKIKKLRLAKGWTQTQLAQRAHVSQQAIWKIETGKASESRKLPAIAAALGVSVEELVEGTEVALDFLRSDVPTDKQWTKLQQLWPDLDPPGKRHVVRSAENEVARIAHRPSGPQGGSQKTVKKRRAMTMARISPIRA